MAGSGSNQDEGSCNVECRHQFNVHVGSVFTHMKKRIAVLRVASTIGLVLSCSSSDDTPQAVHPPGSEQGPCLDGDRCDPGFVCLSHTCVALAGTGGSGGGATETGGRSGTGGGTSGKTGTGGTAGAGGRTIRDASVETAPGDGRSSGGTSNGGVGGADASIGDGGGNGGVSGASGGTGGALGSGGASGGGNAGTGGSSSVDGGSCAATPVMLDRAPLDIYVLLDQSLSMSDSVTGGRKWDLVTAALQTFVQSSDSNGVSIGIGYFPLVVQNPPPPCLTDSDCGIYGPCQTDPAHQYNCTKTDTCLASNYSPDVPIGKLPVVSGAIVSSLGAHSPTGFTPTYPALQASYAYLTGWAQAHPREKSILVLATDGDPTTCDSTTNNVNAIATTLVAPALAAKPSIQTFVVGVGSSLTSMNQIAASGGSGQAFIVDTAATDAGGQFLEALAAIRSSPLLGCQYGVPAGADSGVTSSLKLNVQVTPSSGPSVIVDALSGPSGCTTNGGWYYDDATKPNQILLCDSTCASVRADSGATVRALVGCGAGG